MCMHVCKIFNKNTLCSIKSEIKIEIGLSKNGIVYKKENFIPEALRKTSDVFPILNTYTF